MLKALKHTEVGDKILNMGLRDKFIKRAKKVVDRFSGEYSDPAPEEREPYARPGVRDDEAEVVMAKLNRPKGRKSRP